MTLEFYAKQLIDLAQSEVALDAGMKRARETFDAYIVDVVGDPVTKRKALSDAFKNNVSDTPLTWPIIDMINA